MSEELYPTECPACEGLGVRVHGCRTYEAGCGFAHDDTYETPCPECEGTGKVLAPYETPTDE